MRHALSSKCTLAVGYDPDLGLDRGGRKPMVDGLDHYDSPDAQDDSQNDEDKESVSYIEISSVDHPEAYSYLHQGAPIRSEFSGNTGPSVNDLYADLTKAVGAFFDEGRRMPLLRWSAPSEGHSEATAELINSLVEERDDLEGEVSPVEDED